MFFILKTWSASLLRTILAKGIIKMNSSERVKSGANKKPGPQRSLEEVIQKLEQAKVSGDHFQIKVWTAVLEKLKSKPRS
jgi:hypothetical protein